MAKKPPLSKIIPFFTIIRDTDGWKFVEIATNDNYEVISRIESQPDQRAIIQEAFKIAVGKYWGSLG